MPSDMSWCTSLQIISYIVGHVSLSCLQTYREFKITGSLYHQSWGHLQMISYIVRHVSLSCLLTDRDFEITGSLYHQSWCHLIWGDARQKGWVWGGPSNPVSSIHGSSREKTRMENPLFVLDKRWVRTCVGVSIRTYIDLLRNGIYRGACSWCYHP